jgi:hypothetical protein
VKRGSGQRSGRVGQASERQARLRQAVRAKGGEEMDESRAEELDGTVVPVGGWLSRCGEFERLDRRSESSWIPCLRQDGELVARLVHPTT